MALALCPPLVAVIVAGPTATPVTRPLAETVATAPLLVVHVTVPLVGRPFASWRVAVSCASWQNFASGGERVSHSKSRLRKAGG